MEYWGNAAEGVYAELELDLPSRLADQLRDGHLDVGLIPAVEVLQQPELVIVPDACIACCGPVWSVKLLSRVPLGEIQSLSLDEGSRTSVVLCRLLLFHLHGVEPRTQPLLIGQDWTEIDSDAVLVIGDRAMRACDRRFPFAWDLGEVWHEWTGLPFVFAVWATHEHLLETRPEELRAVQTALNRSRDCGINRLDELSHRYARGYGLSYQECMKYLSEHLNFTFGDIQRRALHRFKDLAEELKFVPPCRELVYHECH